MRNVASRSSQHSKMLGQPASWQTVCRPSDFTRLWRRVVLRAHLRPGLDPLRLALDRGLGVAHLEAEQLASFWGGSLRHAGQLYAGGRGVPDSALRATSPPAGSESHRRAHRTATSSGAEASRPARPHRQVGAAEVAARQSPLGACRTRSRGRRDARLRRRSTQYGRPCCTIAATSVGGCQCVADAAASRRARPPATATANEHADRRATRAAEQHRQRVARRVPRQRRPGWRRLPRPARRRRVRRRRDARRLRRPRPGDGRAPQPARRRRRRPGDRQPPATASTPWRRQTPPSRTPSTRWSLSEPLAPALAEPQTSCRRGSKQQLVAHRAAVPVGAGERRRRQQQRRRRPAG